MPSEGSIPGIRKHGAEPVDDFLKLTDDQQREKIEQELQMWRLNNMDVGRVPHNVFNMDCMLIALVRALTKELGVSEDTLNRHYRYVVYEKLTEIRRDALKSQIHIPPNAAI